MQQSLLFWTCTYIFDTDGTKRSIKQSRLHLISADGWHPKARYTTRSWLRAAWIFLSSGWPVTGTWSWSLPYQGIFRWEQSSIVGVHLISAWRPATRWTGRFVLVDVQLRSSGPFDAYSYFYFVQFFFASFALSFPAAFLLFSPSQVRGEVDLTELLSWKYGSSKTN